MGIRYAPGSLTFDDPHAIGLRESMKTTGCPWLIKCFTSSTVRRVGFSGIHDLQLSHVARTRVTPSYDLDLTRHLLAGARQGRCSAESNDCEPRSNPHSPVPPFLVQPSACGPYSRINQWSEARIQYDNVVWPVRVFSATIGARRVHGISSPINRITSPPAACSAGIDTPKAASIGRPASGPLLGLL